MIISMTGYGRETKETDSISVTVELRSVNHRFSEISVYIPRPFLAYENKVKSLLARHIRRGKVDAYITVEGSGLYGRELVVDWDLLKQYIDILHEAGSRFSLPGQLSIGELLQVPDAFSALEKEGGTEQVENLLLETVNGALAQLMEMRKAEGRHLYDDLQERLERLESVVNTVAENAPKVAEDFRLRLRERVESFLRDQTGIDEARLMNEVAVFSDKANIDEELTRLKSHLGQFRKYLSEEQTVGKKLNFLLQEMNREMNTIGAKGNDFDISVHVVEMKSELEKIKEQIQNIE
ncbi:MAG TPA: YicC/YloC family endoribonuclease [Bacillales bacterium]|nr:YicC/YloC family endoribonuclease [Bacillales bacterium]